MPKTKNDHIKKFEKEASKLLKGKTIKSVRYMTQEEMDEFMWYEAAVVIFFTDGTYIFPSQDPEGNGPGCLFTSSDKLAIIPELRIG